MLNLNVISIHTTSFLNMPSLGPRIGAQRSPTSKDSKYKVKDKSQRMAFFPGWRCVVLPESWSKYKSLTALCYNINLFKKELNSESPMDLAEWNGNLQLQFKRTSTWGEELKDLYQNMSCQGTTTCRRGRLKCQKSRPSHHRVIANVAKMNQKRKPKTQVQIGLMDQEEWSRWYGGGLRLVPNSLRVDLTLVPSQSRKDNIEKNFRKHEKQKRNRCEEIQSLVVQDVVALQESSKMRSANHGSIWTICPHITRTLSKTD